MNNNTTAEFDRQGNATSELEYPAWDLFAWTIFMWLFPPLCFIGTIANAASFCVIVSNRKSFPYVTRQYLSIITASDFLILTCKGGTHYLIYMSAIPGSKISFKTPRDWGFVWCIVYDLFTYYSLVGAQFFQLGLTVDRLIAVAAPMKAKVILTHRRSWVMLGLITAMSLLLPVMFVANRKWHSGSCDFRSQNFHNFVYLPVESYFGRVFPILVLTSGTVAICLLLAWNNRTAARLHTAANATETQRRRQKCLLRISLMLVSINVIFLATSLPWTVSILLKTQLTSVMGQHLHSVMLHHFNSILYANNALSWLAYFMGRNFREAFCRSMRLGSLCRLLRRRRQGSDSRRQSGLVLARDADAEGLEMEATRFLAESAVNQQHPTTLNAVELPNLVASDAELMHSKGPVRAQLGSCKVHFV